MNSYLEGLRRAGRRGNNLRVDESAARQITANEMDRPLAQAQAQRYHDKRGNGNGSSEVRLHRLWLELRRYAPE
jgi:hypothetical protein